MANDGINITAILKEVRSAVDVMVDDIVAAMEAACLEVVRQARLTDTYKDRTGNLRSSIGYAVYKDGVKVSEGYEAHPGTGSGADGVSAAQSFVEEIVKNYHGRTCAIIVAGMDYAVYVESKGFDVVTGSALRFEGIFRNYMNAMLA